jgi:hypothetical protein
MEVNFLCVFWDGFADPAQDVLENINKLLL